MDKKKKDSIEEIAEETGKIIGKGFRKGVNVAKAFVRGAEESYKKKNKKNK